MEDESQSLARSALKAAMATSEVDTGAPYCSLVTIASTHQGAPIMLLSAMARHTKNLAKDPRASLLIEATASDEADPLAGARLTLTGVVRKTSEPVAKQRFLARHPAASNYADFPDFAFFELAEFSAYLIAGFGKFRELTYEEFLVPTAHAAHLLQNEPDLVAEMNARDTAIHLLENLARKPARTATGVGRVTGFDLHGLDLVRGETGHRVVFRQAISTADELWRAVNELISEEK